MRQYTSFWLCLASNILFEGISEETLRTLVGEDKAPAKYPRSTVIFSPTDYIPSLAFIITGSALVYKAGMDGKRILMSRLSPGDVFGMASLFYETEKYPSEIHAETDCQILFLSKAWVEEAFSLEPRLAHNYIALLSERIHFLNRRIESLAAEDTRARLTQTLRTLQKAQGSQTTLTLPFSLSQLAELLGVGRASLYRAIDALEAEGVLTRNGKIITILQPELMERS